MKFIFRRDTWQEIYYALRNNKLRTILTMIGVGWGMFLYVSLLGAAKGMENGFDRLFKGFATNSIFIQGGQTSVPFKGFPKGRKIELHLEDMEMIKNKIPDVKYVSPQSSKGSFSSGGALIVKEGDRKGIYDVIGDFPVGNKVTKKDLLFGRFLNDADIKNRKNVILIGEDVYNNLFDSKKNENPVGQKVTLNGSLFTVIGVFKVNNGVGFFSDNSTFIPFTTFTKMYHTGNVVDFLIVACKPEANLNLVENKIKLLLRNKYTISEYDTTAFSVFNAGKQFKKLTKFLSGMQFLTIIVGALTILAGVIAISSILLITVKERTKEIGIRRAIGAKSTDVRNQILLESTVITLTAGLMGFLSWVIVLIFLNKIAEGRHDNFPFYNPTIAYSNVFVALAIMIILGLIIGLIPAQRAVNIKPIDALRSE